jgi:hypothetical protein
MDFVMPDTLIVNTAGTVSVDVLRWWLAPDNSILRFDVVLSASSPWHEFSEGVEGIDKDRILEQLQLTGIPMRAEFHVTGQIEGRIILTRT